MANEQVFTIEELVKTLHAIRDGGWVPNARPKNDGGVGNTLEDLLGVKENNLRIPDYGMYELKARRGDSSSLVTLFHNEPTPRRIVVQKLLPFWGWRHQTLPGEKSFRQTISSTRFTDRGFRVRIDDESRQVCIDFDIDRIDDRHDEWRTQILSIPQDEVRILSPAWTFDKLEQVIKRKLHNVIIVVADVRRSRGIEEFLYREAQLLQKPSLERFLYAIENDIVLVDFDARTGHNHGTKFRIRQDGWTTLYEEQLALL
ncbi:MAG: hypothetical protein NVS4B11_22260 [Ktedonobacteraceae bacterium]